VHPGCAQGQGQGQRSRDTGTFVLARKSLLSIRQLQAGLMSQSWNELLRH